MRSISEMSVRELCDEVVSLRGDCAQLTIQRDAARRETKAIADALHVAEGANDFCHEVAEILGMVVVDGAYTLVGKEASGG